MTVDYDELRRLALAAVADLGHDPDPKDIRRGMLTPEERPYYAAMTPLTCLALLNEREALLAALAAKG